MGGVRQLLAALGAVALLAVAPAAAHADEPRRSPQQALADGVEAYVQVQYGQAVMYLSAALKGALEKNTVQRAYFYLGCTYLAQEKHDEARAAYLANQEPILALLRSLEARNAIPVQRLRYWGDVAYNPTGRIRTSRKGLFERNGCTGDEIYTHPHFLAYLRYFLYGAELPESVMHEFATRVGEPRWVSSSDAIPLGKAAREIAGRHGLTDYGAPEEFFKLCLDLGLSVDVARTVLRAVKRAA